MMINDKICVGNKSRTQFSGLLFVNRRLVRKAFSLFPVGKGRIATNVNQSPCIDNAIKMTDCYRTICPLIGLMSPVVIVLVHKIPNGTVSNNGNEN